MARTTIASPGFLDRLGDRVIVTDRTGGDLEVLRLRPELTADPAFEPALKARAEQLAAFQHRAAARVRGISRLPGNDGRLAVVSDVAKGWRLSEVLQAAEHEGRLIHTSTVLFLLRQVASFVSALQAAGSEIAHGALGPERIVLSPAGRVLVVEYVLGAALEHLPAAPADRIWKDYRLAVAPDAGRLRFGPETDVLQLGIVALSLVHNRLLKRDEYPGRLVDLLDTATESQVTGARQPLGRVLRDWLEQALGLRPSVARWTMAEAQRALDWIASAEGGYFSTPVGLEPLLQSVERFFTVPSAEAATAASSERLTAPRPLEPPAVEPPVAEHHATEVLAVEPHGIEPHGIGQQGPSAAPECPADAPHSMTVRIRPHVDVAPPPVLAPPIQPPSTEEEPPAPAPAHFPPHDGPALTLIKTDSGVPAALPPAAELLERAVAGEPVAEFHRPNGDVSAAGDNLIVTASPLAEFAAERVTDPFPAPPDFAPEPAPNRPSLWPVPPPHSLDAPVMDDAPAGLAPVADMLSIDRPTGRRRSGWNGEAWLSRSIDRQPSGARTVPSASAAVESPLASGPSSRATTTTRLLRSGAAATAAALRHDAPPAPELLATTEARPVPANEPTPSASSGSHVTASTPTHDAEATQAASERSPAALSGRPMFGWAHDDSGHHEAHTHARPRRRVVGGVKWPAVAALVIVCGGGFAAWKFFGSSNAAPPAAVASARPAASQPARAEAKPTAPAARPQPTPPSSSSAPAAVAANDTKLAVGSLQLVSPFVVNVSERGQALGTSAAPIALTAGPHVLDLSSEEFGYRATRAVEIRPGRMNRAPLALPNGSVNINATPWAEVLVDGQRVGETPLGNVQLPIGSHEVRFKHPQLGEQVRTVTVTAGTPGRLSVDMKQ